jgi:putative membrane protein
MRRQVMGVGNVRHRTGCATAVCIGSLIVGHICAPPAFAHGGTAHVHPDAPWWTVWNWDPVILPNLILLTWLYGHGLVRMWRRSGVGHTVSRGQAFAFAAALLTLFVALISPIDPLSDELSWVHMVQHMLLMMVAAPLFVLGGPASVMVWALPQSWRLAIGRWRRRIEAWHSPWYLLWQPLLMWSLYAVTLWIWHLPALYHAALRDPWIHEFQHLTFFVASCLFWRVLLDPLGRLRLSRGVGVLYLFTTSLHASVLGVFMALSPQVWYSDYDGRTQAWNLTPLQDQQLAGLIMWMPACMMYAVVATAVFAVWLRSFPAEAEQKEFSGG